MTSPVLVGRAPELRWLGAALARVRGGSPAALLIGGGAGAGKTRLVGEFAAGYAAGARVLAGRCPDLGRVGMPFAPFIAIVRELARDPDVAGLIRAQGPELLRWLPEPPPASLPGRPPVSLPGPGGPGWATPAGPGWPAPGVGPRQARARLFVEVLSLLEQLAGRRPVVLVVEDAHWADESTMDLLSFLIGSQQAMDGVLIVATYRSDELRRGHPLCALLSRLDRVGWVQRTELAGLSRDESADLAGHLLGAEPAPSLAEHVYRRAGGNPLFVEELVWWEGQRSKTKAASPRNLMLAAVRRLPERTQEVLRTASARGQRTGRGLLAAATGMHAGALDACLRPAIAGGVLVADDDACVFRHSLVSEAIHADLLPCEHTSAHHGLAAALQDAPSLVPAGWAAIEQAEHWQHVHDPARALSSAWEAAAEAGLVLACAEQLALLARVLEIWPSVPGAERLTGTGHDQVLRQAAEAAEAAGEDQLATALAAAARNGTDARQTLAAARPAAPEGC
jgi:hypothetical protein